MKWNVYQEDEITFLTNNAQHKHDIVSGHVNVAVRQSLIPAAKVMTLTWQEQQKHKLMEQSWNMNS